jgi:hypothetical protein
MTFFSAATAVTTPVAPSPVVCSLPDLPAPALPPSCEEEWKRSASSTENTVIYGLAWHRQHLVAATFSGIVCIWNVPPTVDDEDMDEIEMKEMFEKHRRPVVK